MKRADLRSFVARSQAIRESTPPTATREIRAWVVEPLLSALGWDVRSAGCETDVTVRQWSVDYLLSVDGTPAVAVLVGSPSRSLEDEADPRLRRLMAATGIDRGIVTDGRTLVLYAGTDGSDRFRCALESVHENADALSHFAESRCRRRLERQSRSLAARRLAVRRAALSSAIATELTDVAGEHYAGEFETAAARFVDDLVDSLADEPLTESTLDHGRPPEPPTADAASELVDDDPSEPDTADPPERHDVNRASESDGSSSDPDRSGSKATPEKSASSVTDEADGADPAADRGEYVVRFFNDRGSIGAIGFSRPADALVGTAEFCLERGLSGVRLPWEHDDVTVLNDEPVRADGSPMPAPRGLSNGYVLDTAGDEAARAERIEALASRTGLRVMLSGDWKTDP